MARFFFVTWSGGGNQPPEIGVAQELADRGHAVTFAGYESQRARFRDRGLPFALLERSSAAWQDEPLERRMAALVDVVWASPLHLSDLQDAVARERPDALVVDCLMFGAVTAAADTGLPTAVLVHSAPGALVPPGGPMEMLLHEPVNRLRATRGRPAVASLWDAWEAFPA